MGGGRFDPGQWQDYATTTSYATKSAAQIYTQDVIFPDFDPRNMKNGIRESRDSNDNPSSTPIIVGLDVTGSMSHVLAAMAKQGLKTLMEEVYKRKPVADPHILCAAVGDAFTDRAPLQITQFEADIRIAEQLEKLYLEQGGGGNGSEGYSLLHYFAATHTATDSFAKRQKKGYLFTVGNDGPTPEMTREQAETIFGDKLETDLRGEEILTMASRQWEIFHLHLTEGMHIGDYDDGITGRWRKQLGERAIILTDHTKMAEVIISTIQVLEGADKQKVVASWDGTTSIVVQKAVQNLTARKSGKGIVTL
jgi:hypothetical protein